MLMLNDTIAVEPFRMDHVIAKNRGELVRNKVLIGNNQIPPGSTVLLKGSDYAALWAKTLFTLDEGTPFIIVHVGNVVAVEYPMSGSSLPEDW